MPNGVPGDDPLLDLLEHGRAPYGEPTDSNLREIAKLLSWPRLQDWFQPLRSLPSKQLQPIVAQKLDELRRDARNRGWEQPS